MTRSDRHWAVQLQDIIKDLKFQIQKAEEEELYYLCSENKGDDQLCSYFKLICVFVFVNAKGRFF